jgi:hypothetical protein
MLLFHCNNGNANAFQCYVIPKYTVRLSNFINTVYFIQLIINYVFGLRLSVTKIQSVYSVILDMTFGRSKGNVRTMTIMVRPDDVVHNTVSFSTFCSKPVYYILPLEKLESLY